MNIKCQPFKQKKDQKHITEEFNSYGECSLIFLVFSNQQNETIISYKHYQEALNAHQSLNNQAFRDFHLNLKIEKQFSPDLNEEGQINPIKRYPSDIENIIPHDPVIFLTAAANDSSPTPYSSPFFPDMGQSSRGSSKSSGKSEIYQVESPISVSRLPGPWTSQKFFFGYEGNQSEKVAETTGNLLLVPTPKRKLVLFPEVQSIKPENKDLTFCEVCRKPIKKKSLKSHFSSKLHQSNSKMN